MQFLFWSAVGLKVEPETEEQVLKIIDCPTCKQHSFLWGPLSAIPHTEGIVVSPRALAGEAGT